MNNATYVAATRFGLGVRLDEMAAIDHDPKGWVLQQIRRPQVASNDFATLLSSAATLRETYDLKAKREEMRKNGSADPVKVKGALKETYMLEMAARLRLAITTSTPFYERLVSFWSNHFSVSAKKGFLLGVVGAYEREAIRPYVMGRFSDMLLAVTQHPVMLAYLDNAKSVGPNSLVGEKRSKGLNENLAREIMELHTLGVDGGYTQTDVTSFARVITGWGVGGPNSDKPGLFEFAPKRHEPGVQQVLERSYADNGQGQGIDVLRDLAAHPATAQHIATKLARHFVADEPAKEIVDHIARAFLDSGGALPAVYEALIALPQSWDTANNPKIKSTYDLIVSAMRLVASGEEDILSYSLRSMKFLGNVPFTAESPAGFPDTAQQLVGPESLMRRVEWAQMTARRFTLAAPAAKLAPVALGPGVSDATRVAVASAGTEIEASAILLGSPEFQRR